MQRQVEEWRSSHIIDERAKLILYQAFVDSASWRRRGVFCPGSPPVLRAEVPGVVAANDVELVHRV
jgi:hypothetical protein